MFEKKVLRVAIEEVPEIVRNAFLAAEDANFYQHPGIDIVSILRAVWVNLRSKRTRQGASTITQQVVKSLLLTRERTYERKAKEAILSYRLENQLSKDDIFSIYLNEIFLGSGAYGVKAAARVHFHKELDQLSIAESAYLAGLPQRPSRLSDPRNRDEAIRRQQYVLGQMLKNKMIAADEYELASKEELTIYPPEDRTIYSSPYYTTHAIKVSRDILRQINPSLSPGNPGGFEIHTTLDIKADQLAQKSLRKALRELDKRQGWRGAINRQNSGKEKTVKDNEYTVEVPEKVEELDPDKVYPATVTKVNFKKRAVTVELGEHKGVVSLKEAKWARLLIKGKRRVNVNPAKYLRAGDVIEVSLRDAESSIKEEGVLLKLDQTPNVQGAMVVRNALTGEVKVIVGGYDFQRSSFNRATQGKLQPGSAFKPMIYLAALEDLAYTPSTIVPDSPISLPAGDGTIWSPQNYDRKFYGPITLRTALQLSRNVVSVYLLERLGVRRGIESARKLGITTPIQPNMSISLGTAEVKLIELAGAYGAFAAEGWLADTIVVKSIKNRDGKVLFQKKAKQSKVIDDEESFIMANMMKGVIENGTAQRLKALERPVAGKTGTTDDQMDAWFVGYTPEWVAGVWVGFDVKKTLGKWETGGKAAAPAFLYFMQEFLKSEPEIDFNIPDGVIPVTVNSYTGQLADPGEEYSFTEYFKVGTEPRYGRRELEVPRDYLENSEF